MDEDVVCWAWKGCCCRAAVRSVGIEESTVEKSRKVAVVEMMTGWKAGIHGKVAKLKGSTEEGSGN